MKKIFCLTLILFIQTFPQSIYSPSNIRKFADYLFCTKDYLRAALEFQKYQNISFNDTIQFKIGLAYSRIGDYNLSEEAFQKIPQNSDFYSLSKSEFLKTIFLADDFQKFDTAFSNSGLDTNPEMQELNNFTFFYTKKELPSKQDFLKSFPETERNIVSGFYDFKAAAPYKSSITAAILSSIIPGSGKIYTDRISDGITSFVLVGLFTFLSIDNFNAHHNFRAWIFTATSAFFYAGNVYGSAASTQIYNAKLDYDFSVRIKTYLDSKNYFVPQISFCK